MAKGNSNKVEVLEKIKNIIEQHYQNQGNVYFNPLQTIAKINACVSPHPLSLYKETETGVELRYPR